MHWRIVSNKLFLFSHYKPKFWLNPTFSPCWNWVLAFCQARVRLSQFEDLLLIIQKRASNSNFLTGIKYFTILSKISITTWRNEICMNVFKGIRSLMHIDSLPKIWMKTVTRALRHCLYINNLSEFYLRNSNFWSLSICSKDLISLNTEYF